MNAAQIGVTAKGGVVTLMGLVESFVEKQAAEKAARRVKDVKAVAKEIEVRLPFSGKRGDDDIAEAAANRLAWNTSVPRGCRPSEGRERLDHPDRPGGLALPVRGAAKDARGLFGVVGVSDLTTLKPRVNTAKVTEDIEHALHRSWFYDPKTVTVSAQGGKVRLGGTVRSMHERDVAQRPHGPRPV